MLIQSRKGSQIKFNPFRGKPSCFSSKLPLLAPITSALPQRNQAIDWLYRAHRTLQFSKSTLYLAIAMLDKLLACGMPLTDANAELIGGTLALLSTKFNQIYPVTVKKLQALSTHDYSCEKYVEVEEAILSKLDFDLSPQDSIYEELAELEHRLGQEAQETVRTAVENPAVAFKMGNAALLAAIQSMAVGGLSERRNESRLSRESAELRVELQRLRSRSPDQRRLLSPARA